MMEAPTVMTEKLPQGEEILVGHCAADW